MCRRHFYLYLALTWKCQEHSAKGYRILSYPLVGEKAKPTASTSLTRHNKIYLPHKKGEEDIGCKTVVVHVSTPPRCLPLQPASSIHYPNCWKPRMAVCPRPLAGITVLLPKQGFTVLETRS